MTACRSCSRDVAEGFTFCPYCGSALQSPESAGEERKLVTLLFADVTGSTGLAEALDAEVVRNTSRPAAGRKQRPLPGRRWRRSAP